MNSVLYFYFSICINLNWHKHTQKNKEKKIKKSNYSICLKKQIPFFVELKYWFPREKKLNIFSIKWKNWNERLRYK